MAFVVQITCLISGSKFKNGTSSDQEFSHNRTIAGYVPSQASLNSANRSRAAASVAAV